jgi:hypothetical protein
MARLKNSFEKEALHLYNLQDKYFRELDSKIEARLKGVKEPMQALAVCEEIQESTELGDPKADEITKAESLIFPLETETKREAYRAGYYAAFADCRRQYVRSMVLYYLRLSHAAAKDSEWPETLNG